MLFDMQEQNAGLFPSLPPSVEEICETCNSSQTQEICVIELKMEGAATQTGITSTSSSDSENFSTSTLAYDREFIRTTPGILFLAEIKYNWRKLRYFRKQMCEVDHPKSPVAKITAKVGSTNYRLGCEYLHNLHVFGLMVWTLIGGTEYFRVPAFGWVIFVAILYWVLTVIFFIIYLTVVKKVPRVSWKTVGLCFNSSATVMYAVATGVEAASISKDARGRYNYNCWTASTFFALLVTLCYAGSAYFSFKSWRLRKEQQ